MMDDTTAPAKETQPRGYKPVGAARAAVRILRFLAGAPTPLGVTAIARELDLYPGTCFNLLKTLHEEQFVAFDPVSKTYSLGHRVLELSHGLLRSAGYLDMVRPRLREISNAFQVTIYLFKLDRSDRVVIVDSVGAGTTIDVQVSTGRRISPYQGAIGRIVAAHRFKTAAELRDILDRIPWQDRPSDERFDREVAEARVRGYGLDRDMMVRGLSAVAVPVLRDDGALALVLSAVGLTSFLNDTRLPELAGELREIAKTFSHMVTLLRD